MRRSCMTIADLVHSAERAHGVAQAAKQLAEEFAACAARLNARSGRELDASVWAAVLERLQEYLRAQPERQRRLLHLENTVTILVRAVGETPALAVHDRAPVSATRTRLAHPTGGTLIDLEQARLLRSRRTSSIRNQIDDLNASCAFVEADNVGCKADLETIKAMMEGGRLSPVAPRRNQE